jgi:hypothetical protein
VVRHSFKKYFFLFPLFVASFLSSFSLLWNSLYSLFKREAFKRRGLIDDPSSIAPPPR